MSTGPPVPTATPTLVRLAERDLIRDRLPFFAVLWAAVSVLWLNALMYGGAGSVGWGGAAAILAAQLVILTVAVRMAGRTSSPGAMRAIVLLAIGLLGLVWTVVASYSAAPFDVLALVMPILVVVPPLFFAWSWRVELVLMVGLGLQAALWFSFVMPGDGTVLADIAITALAGAALGVALAARVSHELGLRIARREQEEASRRALAASNEAFLASEERFRVAFHRAPIGMAMVGADGAVLQVNAAFERMVGRPAAEIVGTPVDDLILPDDLPSARAEREQVLGGAVDALETVMRLRHRDGHGIWVRVTRALVRDRDGKPAYMIGQVEDVTERLRAEEALRASLAELRTREEQLRLLAQRQVKVREEERRRLGFDLHDDVCQELVGTGIMVESVRGRLQGIDPEASQKLARVSRHLNDLGEHLRQVARELRPMLLHDLGLEDSVRSLATGMTSATTRVIATSTTPIPRLSEDVEVAVYRIVQEAITNALRHAGAREIAVTLAASEGVLRVEVRDDGGGFDVEKRQRDALGLVSMEERALALGGKLAVQSASGRGTSVRLTCPLIRRVPRPAA